MTPEILALLDLPSHLMALQMVRLQMHSASQQQMAGIVLPN
jgi:hypothetical protein